MSTPQLSRVPGTNFWVASSIVGVVAELLRDFPITLTAAYATSGHAVGGDHPKGLGIDFVPDPARGGTWADVAAVVKRAEPQQNKPNPGLRWVGYNGDAGHGDPAHDPGNAHAHLSFTGDAKAAAQTLFGGKKSSGGALTTARRVLQGIGAPALWGAELAGGPAADAAHTIEDAGADAGKAAAGAAAKATADATVSALQDLAKSQIGANAARWALYAGLVIAGLVVLYAGVKRTVSDS